MRQSQAGSHLMGQRSRDRPPSSAFDFLPPPHRASRAGLTGFGLSPLTSRHYAGTRFVSGASSMRNDYERYMQSLAPYGVSDATLRNALLAQQQQQQNELLMTGYIPPGTHSVPISYHQMNPPTPRPHQGPSHRQFLPPLLSRPDFTSSTYHELNKVFLDDESFFPMEPLTLPPIHSGGLMDYGRNYALSQDDFLEEEILAERRGTFPELPLDAHRRIFQMGNDIVDCIEVRLERFFRGSLLDSASGCLAVFTKKDRTGQRWLMVFKEDINRSVVKFNRLLTHSLLVRVQGPLSIEIEAAKAYHGPPAEMCVLNFRNEEDAARFHKTLHECQTTAWNHKEVTQEQRMKVFQRNSSNVPQYPEVSTMTLTPPPRSPFTMGSLGLAAFLTPNQNQASPSMPGSASAAAIADLDNDWRSRCGSLNSSFHSGGGDESPTKYIPESPIPKRPLQKNNKSSSPSLFDSMTHKNALRRDYGGGDCAGPGDLQPPEFLEEVTFVSPTGTLFIKKNAGGDTYDELGTGRLQIVDHGTAALNEIIFKGEDGDTIYSQFIFRWNSARLSGDGSGECDWDGTAFVLKSADQATTDTRDFKMDFRDVDTAHKFIQAFRKGLDRGCDPVVKKRHVSWFIQNRGHSIHKK